METEITRKRDIERVLPTSSGDLKQMFDGRALAVETFAEQAFAPTFGHEQRVVQELLRTANAAFGTIHAHGIRQQTGKVILTVRIAESTLGDSFALRIEDLLVGIAHDMQDNIVVRTLQER